MNGRTVWMAAVAAAAVAGMAMAQEEGGWKNECASIDGWRSNAEDPSMNAKVEISEPSVMKVQQEGESTWGKVTYFIDNLDVEAYPELVVKVNKVDLNSAYTVQAAPSDWSEFVTVIPRCSADGKKTGNLKRALKSAKNPKAFGEPAQFHLVIVIEGKGKATYFDEIRIQAKD